MPIAVSHRPAFLTIVPAPDNPAVALISAMSSPQFVRIYHFARERASVSRGAMSGTHARRRALVAQRELGTQ